MTALRSKWDWQVTCYYSDKAQPPRVPGELAIQTVHVGEASRDVEIAAARSRPEIGTIDVVRLR